MEAAPRLLAAKGSRSGTSGYRLVFPKEYGAWALLLVPLATGLAQASALELKLLLLVVGVLGLFLARYPLLLYLRAGFGERNGLIFSLLVYSVVGLLPLAILVFFYRLWLLLAFGVFALGLFGIYMVKSLSRTDRTLAGQLLGLFSLTLTAPLGYYLATGSVGGRGLWLWLMNILFFIAELIYVRMKVGAQSKRQRLISLGNKVYFARACLAYHLALLLCLLLFVTGGLVPISVLVAFVPTLIQAGLGTAKLDKALEIKRLGRLELAHSLVFGSILIWAFRAWPQS
ncbi:MAG: YwiC-like family protein [Thermodesulfobacteriota bacterium]